jgi:photosystem II stability/assembly factor-like uncharacterized protein
MPKYSNCSSLAINCPVWNDVKRTSPYVNGTISDGTTYYRTNSSGIISEVGSCPTEAFIQYATINNNYLKKSNDSGISWFTAFANAGTSNWIKVDVSQNGQYVFVIDSNYVLRSSNYGSEFSFSSVRYTNTTAFRDIAVSRSGQYVILAEETGYILTSNDYGINWTARTSPGSRTWRHCSISGNGQYMLATAGNNHNRLYRSGDYGVTWAPVSDSWFYLDSAISDSGQYQAVIRNDGWLGGGWQSHIAMSNNYGLTWQNETPGNVATYKSVDISGTGQYVVAGTTNATRGVRKNNNYGVAGSWSNTAIAMPDPSNFYGDGISISSSGQTVLVADWGNFGTNYLYISRDYGVSFTGVVTEGSQNWSSVVIAPTTSGGSSCPPSGIQDGDAYCSGVNYVALFTDGNCGTYEGVIYYNYSGCGFSQYYCDCGYGCDPYPNPCYYYSCNECPAP